MARTFLVLAGLLLVVALAAAKGPPGFDEAGLGKAALFSVPSSEYRLVMGLAGTAESEATAEAYALSLDLSGGVARDEPRTMGQQEAGALDAHVKIVDPARHTVVDAFTATANYAAHRGTGAYQGTDGWAFTLDLASAGAPLSMHLHGNLTGLQVQDGHAAGPVNAGGFVAFEDGSHAASRFSLSLAGEATEDRAG